jgi:hypothetical protein
MRRVVVLTVILGLIGARYASAQIAVSDVPVLGAVGQAVIALKSILDEARQQVASLADWPAILEEVQALAQLTTDVEALAREVQSLSDGWDQLSDSGQILCSLDEAVQWKGQALQWQQQGFRLARVGQRLLGRTVAVLRDLQVVLHGIIGPTSGAQSSSALLAVITAQLEQLQGMTATFNGASMGHDVIESIVGIQLVCIQQQAYQGWGDYSR